eukprot:8299212-Heterocapsa_arctica.AAC.1
MAELIAPFAKAGSIAHLRSSVLHSAVLVKYVLHATAFPSGMKEAKIVKLELAKSYSRWSSPYSRALNGLGSTCAPGTLPLQ